MRNLFLLLCLTVGMLPAATLYTFNWNTSALNPNTDYILDVLLIGTAGNQATLSGFQYGGGSGPTNNLVLSTATNFFNEEFFTFRPGTSLSFSILVTELLPADPSEAPDQLSIYLLDTDFGVFGTTDLAAFAIATLDLGAGQYSTYAGTDPIAFAAPRLIPPENPTNPPPPEIPEPGTLGLTLGALTWWCLRRRKV